MEEQIWEQYLALMDVRDEKVSGKSLGTLSEIMKDHKGLAVFHNVDQDTKELKDHAVIIYDGFKTAAGNPGTVTVLLSRKATVLARKGLIGMDELSGFPVIWNDKQNSMYVGIPSLGWFKQNEIIVKAYVARALDYADASTTAKLAGV